MSTLGQNQWKIGFENKLGYVLYHQTEPPPDWVCRNRVPEGVPKGVPPKNGCVWLLATLGKKGLNRHCSRLDTASLCSLTRMLHKNAYFLMLHKNVSRFRIFLPSSNQEKRFQKTVFLLARWKPIRCLRVIVRLCNHMEVLLIGVRSPNY